jgi:hypothetical protein
MALLAAVMTGIVMSRMRVFDSAVDAVKGMLGFGGGPGQQADHAAPASGRDAGRTAGNQVAEEIRAPITPGGQMTAKER